MNRTFTPKQAAAIDRVARLRADRQASIDAPATPAADAEREYPRLPAVTEQAIQHCAAMCETALISADMAARKDQLIVRDFWRMRAQTWSLKAFRAATA